MIKIKREEGHDKDRKREHMMKMIREMKDMIKIGR